MIESSLNKLARKQTDSIFAAFYSLPELREMFLAVVGENREEPWSAQSPQVFLKKLDEGARKEIITRVAAFLDGLEPEDRGRTMHALTSWCDADSMFRFAMAKCSSNDKKFEALRRAGATSGVFDTLGEEKRGAPELLGEKLTATERSAFYMQALNAVAQIGERGQLAYFSEVFGVWSDRETG